MKKLFIIMLCGTMIACKSKSKDDSKKENTTTTDSATILPHPEEKTSELPSTMMVIEKLADDFSGDSALLNLGDNKFITVYTEETEAEKMVEDAAVRCPSVKKELECNSHIFQGCVRGNVKTTMVTGEPREFATLTGLLSILDRNSPDIEMKTKGISALETSVREPEENQNVHIRKVYLYQIYREPDNDYHMIVGDSPDFGQARLMNIEISAIPRGASTALAARFMRVRNRIINHPKFGDIQCGRTLTLIEHPLEITNLKGSLYFDLHTGGTVGRGPVKAPSAWEIHPVTDLIFGRFL